MKHRLPLIVCAVAILALVLHACMKDFVEPYSGGDISDGSNVITVEEARAFFQKTYLNNAARSGLKKRAKLNPGGLYSHLEQCEDRSE